MKEYIVKWDEVIIYHRWDTCRANSAKEAIQMVKDMQVSGYPDTKHPHTETEFDKILQSTIRAKEDK